MAKAEERVNPMRITDTETGETYVLEFSRESVKFAEQRGFKISELTDYPQTNIPALFFYAFRKNHKKVARNQTDKLLEDMGGLTTEEITRLAELYNQPNESLILMEGAERKNARLTVELQLNLLSIHQETTVGFLSKPFRFFSLSV